MNKNEVLDYLNEKQACDSAIAGFILHKGTLEEFYNECPVDWRIWLHNLLGLDPKPYRQYDAVVSPAYARFLEDEILYTVYRKIEDAAWQKWQDETMKDWALVEKALQAAIDSS